jgi:hypothetical protein
MDPLDSYANSFGNIRGALITIERTGKRANGPLQLHVERSEVPPAELPEPFNLKRLLEKLWETPTKNAEQKARIVIPGLYEPSSKNGQRNLIESLEGNA